MSTQKHHSAVAATYARSLLELALQQGVVDAVREELTQVAQAVQADQALKLFMADPSISRDERARLIESTLKPQINPLLANFLQVVNLNGRMAMLDQIASAFESAVDEHNGRVDVEVTVATALDDAQLDQVRQRVSQALQKQAVVKQRVDDAIIGGLVLKVQDKLIDASVRSQLESMKQQFISAKPR